jgi:hypothetical protein
MAGKNSDYRSNYLFFRLSLTETPVHPSCQSQQGIHRSFSQSLTLADLYRRKKDKVAVKSTCAKKERKNIRRAESPAAHKCADTQRHHPVPLQPLNSTPTHSRECAQTSPPASLPTSQNKNAPITHKTTVLIPRSPSSPDIRSREQAKTSPPSRPENKPKSKPRPIAKPPRAATFKPPRKHLLEGLIPARTRSRERGQEKKVGRENKIKKQSPLNRQTPAGRGAHTVQEAPPGSANPKAQPLWRT